MNDDILGAHILHQSVDQGGLAGTHVTYHQHESLALPNPVIQRGKNLPVIFRKIEEFRIRCILERLG